MVRVDVSIAIPRHPVATQQPLVATRVRSHLARGVGPANAGTMTPGAGNSPRCSTMAFSSEALLSQGRPASDYDRGWRVAASPGSCARLTASDIEVAAASCRNQAIRMLRQEGPICRHRNVLKQPKPAASRRVAIRSVDASADRDRRSSPSASGKRRRRTIREVHMQKKSVALTGNLARIIRVISRE